MSQQVNLFNPSLVKAKDWFSVSAVAIIYLVTACTMYLFYVFSNQDVEAVQAQRTQVLAAFQDSQKKLNALSGPKQTVVNSKEDEVLVSYLQQKIDSQAKIIDIFKSAQSGDQAHVADYLRGLAHLSTANVWITGMKLEPFKQHVTLQGRAMSAELVPLYIQQLGQEPVFSGKLFGSLKLKEIEQAIQSSQPVAPMPAISSNGVPAAITIPVASAGLSAAATSANKNEATTTKMIEFDMIGFDTDPASKGKTSSSNSAPSAVGGGQ